MSSPREVHSNLRIPNNIVCIQMSPQQMETKSIPPSQPFHRPNQTIQLSQITIYPLRHACDIIKWRYTPESSHVFHRKQASQMDQDLNATIVIKAHRNIELANTRTPELQRNFDPTVETPGFALKF